MDLRKPILVTAFLEGLSVLIVEIAGARALAPYFGTSLKVWTAQITATLLFLALGYGLGGRLSAKAQALRLPGVFWGAGAWLGLFPWLRNGVLQAASALPGIAPGSFVASAVLFGLPLCCLGAVSPLLIQRLEEGRGNSAQAGGAAAGSIFLVNTLGGLAGGWLTALALVPHLPLRVALGSTGVGLALLGSLWAWPSKRRAPALVLPLLVGLALAAAPRPAGAAAMNGTPAVVLHRQQSGVGLIQVLDLQDDGAGRVLLLDGIIQGGMERSTGLTSYEFSEYLAYLSWAYHPGARRALCLGLGTGGLARQLHARGLEVDVAEIEPAVEQVARRYFGLPAEIAVHAEDARAFLNRIPEQWDLIFLDAFAGETSPWYLMTEEGLRAIKARLKPGGRLLVNTVTRADGSPGLARLEAGLLETFGQAEVYVEEREPSGHGLVSACLVAGAAPLGFAAQGVYPGKALPQVSARVQALLPRVRDAKAGGKVCTDDLSDLEWAEAELRLEWRRAALATMGPELLGD